MVHEPCPGWLRITLETERKPRGSFTTRSGYQANTRQR